MKANFQHKADIQLIKTVNQTQVNSTSLTSNMTKPSFIIILLVLISILSSTSASRRFVGTPPRVHKTHSINVVQQYTYEIKYFEQTLDHFSFNDNLPKFQQRYLINTDHWVGPTRMGPIFLYCGNEGDIEWFAVNSGFVWELAPRFGALVVFPEVSFYLIVNWNILV